MKFFFSFFFLLSLLVLTGCFSTSATIEDAKLLANFNSFSFPVKFYVEKITATPRKEKYIIKGSKNLREVEIPVFLSSEEKHWREGLYQYWPHLFSTDPENALKVNFILDSLPQTKEENGGGPAVFAILLSTFTFGIIPAVWHEKHRILVRVNVNDSLTSSKQMSVKSRIRGNNAIFGLWGTRFLIPEIEGAIFQNAHSLDSSEFVNMRVKEDKLKLFLQLFVAELHRLPADQIQKLYLSTKTKETQLLE